ncbi:MAG TPA: hypothetical protein VIV66_04555 [Pyrinomonadaceae bacterium]
MQQSHPDPDTDIGGQRQAFPDTSHSAILAAKSDDHDERHRGFEAILTSYWKPVYKYIRLKWQASNEDAKDLTQGFFAVAIEKNYFAAYDPLRASFQTFLRTCLDRFIANHRKSERRLKRGGFASTFSLDFENAEAEFTSQQHNDQTTPEEYFYREWVRSLFTIAIETLRHRYDQQDRSVRFRLFEIYDLREDHAPKPSYAELGRQFGLSTTYVNNSLAAARRDFRSVVLEKLRDLTGSPEEFRREARDLLGMKIG